MPSKPFFTKIFARSPVSPIQKHMKIAYQTAGLLPDFFDVLLKQEWDEVRSLGTEIRRLEGEADDIKRQVRESLSRSLFMPVSRSDLLELLNTQDKVPNLAKDIVGLSMGREMEFPEELNDGLKKLVASAVQAVAAAMQALDKLDALFVSGFSGKEIELISNMITTLSKVEHESDDLQREVQISLYKIEKSLHPVDVMFLYRIIDWVGDIADSAQSVGNRILYLIAK